MGMSMSGIVTFSNTTESTDWDSGSVLFSGGVGIAKSLHVKGNISAAGTITYEDVTNVDSIGIVTANSGINVSVVTAVAGAELIMETVLIYQARHLLV